MPLVAAEELVAAARTGMLKEREWVMSDEEKILDRKDAVRYTSRTRADPQSMKTGEDRAEGGDGIKERAFSARACRP